MVPAFDDDGDTTAAQRAPAAGLAPPPVEGADAEDSTLQQLPDAPPAPATPTATAASAKLGAGAGPQLRRAPRRPMMTLLGTGPASASDDDDSVTDPSRLVAPVPLRVGSSPVPRVGSSPGAPASSSASTPMPEEVAEETEVRTLVANVVVAPAPLGKSAGDVRPEAPTLADPRAEPETPLFTLQPTKARPKLPVAPPGVRKAPSPKSSAEGVGDRYLDDEDSVTTRGNAVQDEELESVTTRAKFAEAARAAAGASASEVSTDKNGIPKPSPAAGSPARSGPEEDPESLESLTAPAPGNLTEMLREFTAAPDDRAAARPIDQDEEDELIENQTAVMANRPWPGHSGSVPVAAPASAPNVLLTPSGPYLSPFAASSSAAVKAAEPMAESAPRLMGAAPAPIDHASIGALATGPRPAQEPPRANPGYAPAAVPETFLTPPPKAPRYGALVSIAIAVSIAIPIGVFYLLRARTELSPSTLAPTAPSSEIVRREEPVRPKAIKPTSSSPRRR